MMTTRTETASILTNETGFQVSAHDSCFSLWDGQNRWMPLYTSADVRRKAHEIKDRLTSQAVVDSWRTPAEMLAGGIPGGL